jgi:hypothetical protein
VPALISADAWLAAAGEALPVVAPVLLAVAAALAATKLRNSARLPPSERIRDAARTEVPGPAGERAASPNP